VRRSMRASPAAPGCALLCILFLLVGGCSRRAAGPRPGDLGADTGVVEEGIGPGDSSLDLAREGRTSGEGTVLHDVYFPFDSDELDDAAHTALDGNVTWLTDNANVRVELEGHCDSRGTVEYNLALGARRARAVQEYLVGQGVAAERLTTISYGKELPVCREETEACWARNRRVHFVAGGR
jgi:peptidoglycan-associated lipoprotein